VYLLSRNRSRGPSPVRSPEPCPPRGQKRDLRERRGKRDPEPLAATIPAEAEFDPLIPEIVMGLTTAPSPRRPATLPRTPRSWGSCATSPGLYGACSAGWMPLRGGPLPRLHPRVRLARGRLRPGAPLRNQGEGGEDEEGGGRLSRPPTNRPQTDP